MDKSLRLTRSGNRWFNEFMVVAFVALTSASCTSHLHPRHVLPGHGPENLLQKASALDNGMATEDVRTALGEPWQSLSDGPRATWIYNETFRPRGCRQTLFGLTLSDVPLATDVAILSFCQERLVGTATFSERAGGETVESWLRRPHAEGPVVPCPVHE